MRLLAFALLLLTGFAQAAAPVVVCTPNRTTGVAPLMVHLDCTGTTDADTTRPFHDLIYQHSFGETSAGKWSQGSNNNLSKNSAYGPIAAHVYETAGTYVIKSTVSDGTSVSTKTNTITVSAADTVFSTTNTICIAANTLPVAGSGGCPTGADVSQNSNGITAISANIATHKRILFKRGDTFTVAGDGADLNVDGPGIVGAYGTGSDPILQATANSSAGMIGLGSASVSSVDWRIMDLKFDANGHTSTIAIKAVGGALIALNQITILRVTVIGANMGVSFADNTRPYNEVAVVDSNFSQVAGTSAYAIGFMAITKLAILGNVGDASGATGVHAFRMPNGYKWVISNNTLTGGSFSALDLLGKDAEPYTKYGVVSDNKTLGFGLISLRPQNASVAEIIEDTIIERNFVGTTGGIIVSAVETTVRNNLIVFSATTTHNGMLQVNQRGIEPTPDNNRVVNNTIYSADTDNDFVGISLGATVTDTIVKNNLGYAPNDSNHVLLSGTGASGLDASNNSSTAQTGATDPLFDDPTNPIGFRIGTGSYGANGGTALFPSSNDDFFHCDDTSANEHMGAFISRTRARCKGGT